MTGYERVVAWTGTGLVAVGAFLSLVWVRTLVGHHPPRPMPVTGLGAFWLGNGGALFLGLGWLVRAAVHGGQAAHMGRPLAASLAAVGLHRVVSGLFEAEVRAWMGAFVVPEGLALLALAGYLWIGGARERSTMAAPSSTRPPPHTMDDA